MDIVSNRRVLRQVERFNTYLTFQFVSGSRTNQRYERDCNTYLELYLADLSSHATIIQKSKNSDSRAINSGANCEYKNCSFELWGEQNEIDKKKGRNKERSKTSKLLLLIYMVVRRTDGSLRGSVRISSSFCCVYHEDASIL